MQITYSKLLIQDVARPGADLVDPEIGDRWLIATKPLTSDAAAAAADTVWAPCRGARSPKVPVPLFPYITGCDPVDSLGFAISLGVIAATQLQQRSIKRLHIAIGHPCLQVPRGGELVVQFFCGFAVLLNPATA